MENIILLLQGAAILLLVILGIVALLFPVLLDISFKEHTGKGCINYWLTAAEAICILAMGGYRGDEAADEFDTALGFLVIVIIISIIVARKKAKQWEMDKLYTFLVVVAQIMSPISIFFIILMISSAVQAVKGDKNESKK